ncbi:uncharacterized protein LOC133192925 isoform X2 [Saccostrea echinata]|uniref:uncharacterized protein LOC133192925 isoform X2 n=1 Tax=Saccostrea echinata TaxID=191078 RepID=UPI002A7F42ED|nr:uncharacterized protein LOC133192925 isoform X2 [Saccostrea echinata]
MYVSAIKRCSYVIILSVCGYLTIAMLKKLFRRGKKTKAVTQKDSAQSLEMSPARLSELSVERLLPESEQDDEDSDSASMKVLGASTGSRSCSESSSYARLNEDARETDGEYKKTCRQLNSAMQKFRRKEAKIKKRQRDIVCMHHELCELTRLMHLANVQANSLDQALDHTKMEMATLCSQNYDSEEDIRKREPLCYKKFKNASTKADTEKVLNMIRGRQNALRHLEVLAYKKLLMHSNSLNNARIDINECSNKDKKSAENMASLRSRRKPPTPPKPNFRSPGGRLNSHLQSAQTLLNELLQISGTVANGPQSETGSEISPINVVSVENGPLGGTGNDNGPLGPQESDV